MNGGLSPKTHIRCQWVHRTIVVARDFCLTAKGLYLEMQLYRLNLNYYTAGSVHILEIGNFDYWLVSCT